MATTPFLHHATVKFAKTLGIDMLLVDGKIEAIDTKSGAKFTGTNGKDVLSAAVGYTANGNLPLWSNPGFMRDEPAPTRKSQRRDRPRRANI